MSLRYVCIRSFVHVLHAAVESCCTFQGTEGLVPQCKPPSREGLLPARPCVALSPITCPFGRFADYCVPWDVLLHHLGLQAMSGQVMFLPVLRALWAWTGLMAWTGSFVSCYNFETNRNEYLTRRYTSVNFGLCTLGNFARGLCHL
jgi:hypothetical protein